MSGLTSVVLAAAALSMRVDAPERDVLTGEPVKLVITWTSAAPLKARLADPLPRLKILTDDGSGWRRFDVRYDSEEVVGPDELRPGERLVTELVLVQGAYGNDKKVPLFSKEGEYSLRLSYQLNENVSVTSNTVRFRVSAPVGGELEIYSVVKAQPGFLLTSQSEELSRRFPASRYLRVPALRRLQKRVDSLLSRQDPDSGETYGHLGRAQWEDYCGRRLRAIADELLSREDWGAFEADRLEKAADLLERAQDGKAADGLRRQIVDRYPRSRAAAEILRARQEEASSGDDEEGEGHPSLRPSPIPKQQ